VILLGDASRGASYAAADLKLLNTIALQTASAIENSFLCAEMIETARERSSFLRRVSEARSQSGDLYGFDCLGPLTCLSAHEIAETARSFGQEDDISVLTIAVGGS